MDSPEAQANLGHRSDDNKPNKAGKLTMDSPEAQANLGHRLDDNKPNKQHIKLKR